MDQGGLIRALDRSGLGGAVIGSGDDGYERLRRVWNGVFDRRPAAIVRPVSVPDVQRVIAVAGEAGSLLAVRCGGHSFPGFSTCDGGIVLDLSPMDRVVIDPVAGTAEVGGGALLGDLDRAASPYGLVMPAGVVSHTGAAGLTLGGGMGWLSRRLGLTIDSLLAAEVCLADGHVVRVSEAEEPELFWGLRGGGGNFGVVTRFEFRLHELGPVLVGSWIYPAAQAGGVLARYAAAATRASRQLSTAFTATADGIRVTAMWSGEPVWDDPADDTRCLTWGRGTAAQLSALSMSGNYVNEQSDTGGDVTLNAYGTQKYARLAALKAHYDPENLFRLNQNLTPTPRQDAART